MLGLVELFIFMCIFGYIIRKNGTSTMIDIITTRFHDAYSRIIPQDFKRQQNGRIIREQNIDLLKRPSDEQHKRFPTNEVKSSPICNGDQQSISERRTSLLPSHGLICQDCSRNLDCKPEENIVRRALEAVDILKVTQHASTESKYDWGTYCPHLAQNLRLKKYEYKPIFDKVIKHKHVREEIERIAKNATKESNVNFEDEDAYYSELLKTYTKKAHQSLMQMRCTLSDKLLRLTSYVLYKLLPLFLDGVVNDPAQIEMIKEAQKKMPKTPLVFLPLHRSHLDYILITFILLNNDIQCPQVAAGDNLNIPVFGYLLRGLGAFYIKRKIDLPDGKKDYIYRSLLQAYLQESIIAGHNVEFFIEGGRTRTGKPNLPKSGILSVIIEAFIDGLIDDAILVPVSVNYEKLVDGHFVNEQMGTPKKMESFRTAVSSIWKILNDKYGLMRIDFNEPFSLKELVKSFKKRQEEEVPRPLPSARTLLTGPSVSSINGIEVVDKHRVLVDNIARHVVFDSSSTTCVMSTNIVAFLLLNKFRNGCTMRELSYALDELKQQIGNDRDFEFRGDTECVIERAVMLLGSSLIQRKVQSNGEVFIAPVLNVPNVIETAYYSNTFVPYFALDAVVTTTVATVNEKTQMGLNDVIDIASLLCDILRYEFIFYKPCQDFSDEVKKSVVRLCNLGILSNVNNSVTMNFKPSQTLLSTLAPFTISYSLVAECLVILLHESIVSERDFIKICLSHIHRKVDKGDTTYGESLSTDSIKNCLKVLERWAVLDTELQKGSKMLSLNPLYNSTTQVQSVIDKFEKFVILK
ncbi:CLUMA_CG004618, isoform A [Clunio marinus]|uniref:CLUMA_CG004618, isoform A n=1 Tax=Clunio marinus TaxID=568069 RepID=A0A1J1HXP9_9DIPT|nr:CLUMA_CG004618, isoform A [Clunio marinus]